jgi:hypothetical protein
MLGFNFGDKVLNCPLAPLNYYLHSRVPHVSDYTIQTMAGGEPEDERSVADPLDYARNGDFSS